MASASTRREQCYRLVIALFLCAYLPSTQAKQLEFNRIQQADQTLLSWVWKDAQSDQHYLKASIDTETLVNAGRGTNKFRLRHYNQYQVKAARKAEARLPPGVNLRLVHSGHTYFTELVSRGAEPEVLAQAQLQFQQILEQSGSEYLASRRLIQFQDAHGKLLILPDLAYYTIHDIRPMHPLLESLREQVRLLPPHQAIERVLSFVQTIPEDPYDESGSSYRSPLSVLIDNRADVASKATLAAALIRGVYPQRPLTLMYMDKHLILGVQINYDLPGKTYYDGQQVWICAEVASRKPIEIGKVTPETEKQLAAQAVELIVIPEG